MQAAIQSHQDANKNQAIVYASKLLCYAPEKEQMLLSMLVNKLGDPSSKVCKRKIKDYKNILIILIIINCIEGCVQSIASFIRCSLRPSKYV